MRDAESWPLRPTARQMESFIVPNKRPLVATDVEGLRALAKAAPSMSPTGPFLRDLANRIEQHIGAEAAARA